MKKFSALMILAVVIAMFGTAFFTQAGFPVIVVDDLGREVTMPYTPSRIVCISPSVTEMVQALGLGDRVVAVDIYSDYPPEAIVKQRISNISFPDLEEVIALDPDLVVMYSFKRTRDPAIENLEDKLKAPIIVTSPVTFDDILRDLRLIGNATGKSSEAEVLVANLKMRINRISNLTSDAASKPRVYFELWYPPYTVSSESWPHHLIEVAGEVNVFGDSSKTG